VSFDYDVDVSFDSRPVYVSINMWPASRVPLAHFISRLVCQLGTCCLMSQHIETPRVLFSTVLISSSCMCDLSPVRESETNNKWWSEDCFRRK
jgi:hypothetical protein